MDPEKRIAELESQVRDLNEEVRVLRQEQEGATAGQNDRRRPDPPEYVDEGHGVAWANRTAVVVTMTAIIVGTILGLGTDALEAVHKGTAAFLYALLACAILGAAPLFLALHRRIMLTWLALIATYLAYVFYFRTRPAHLPIPEDTYFWLATTFLSSCYLAFCGISLVETVKVRQHHGVAALMGGVNSLLYFSTAWTAVLRQYPAWEDVFRLGFAVFLMVMAAVIARAAPGGNYLFQVFTAKAFLLLTWALYTLLPKEYLPVALAAECIPLAFLFKRTGALVFKALGYVLVAVVLAGCISATHTRGAFQVWGYAIPSIWFTCASVAGIFALIAWGCERFKAPPMSARNDYGRPWVTRGTRLELQTGTASMLYAASGALLLLIMTVMSRWDDPLLPYILGVEGFAVMTAGFLLRTFQIEAASVLLIAAAHVTHHFFAMEGKQGFETHQHYMIYTLLLVGFTYFGAYLWERYLHHVGGDRAWERDLVACIPYLAATFLLASLMGRGLGGMYGPLAQNGLGVLLLLIGAAVVYPSVRIAGVFALGIGTAGFFTRLYYPGTSLLTQDNFLLCLCVMLASYAVGERVLAYLHRRGSSHPRFEDMVRTMLVAAAGALGILAVNEWADKKYLTLFWLAHAAAGSILGIGLREARYIWAAFLILALGILRALHYDLQILPQPYQYVVGAMLVTLSIVVGWAYGWGRSRSREPAGVDQAHGTASDG